MEGLELKHDPAVADEARGVFKKLAELEGTPSSGPVDNAADEKATDAPRPILIGGVVYLCAKIRPADLMACRTWAMRRAPSPLQALVNDPAYKLLPVAVQLELARTAGEQFLSGNKQLGQADAERIMNSPAGVAFMAWLLIRHHHPDLKLETLTAVITDDTVDQVSIELGDASGMSELLGNLIGRAGSSAPTPA